MAGWLLTHQVHLLSVCAAGLAVSDSAEEETLSSWGDDAAVYSSESELSDWEAAEDSDADSAAASDSPGSSHDAAAGELEAHDHVSQMRWHASIQAKPS